MKKRLISMALAVSMAVSVVPAPVFTENIGGGGKNFADPDPVAVQASDTALATYATQGDTFTDRQGVKYTITKVAAGDDKGEVEVSGYTNSLSGEVTIPDTVEYSGQEYKVTSIGACAFQCCTNLSSVTISNNVTFIGQCAFNNCTSLTNIKISSSVTEIGYLVFGGCTSLNNVVIPNSVTSIGMYAFSGCTGLSNLTIPGSVTEIGYGAFYGCSSLNNVTIPKSVTSIDNFAFFGCTSLSSVTIPSSAESIGDSAFCQSGLTSVTIPSSVTSIDNYAFDGCSGLTSVKIPNSVTAIGTNAFSNCNSLNAIYFTGTSEKWRSFNQGNLTNSKVHYVRTLALNNSAGVVVKMGDTVVNGAAEVIVPATEITDGKAVTLTVENPETETYAYKWVVTGATANVSADTASCTLNVKDEDVTVSLTRIQKLTVGDLTITFPDGEYDGAEKNVTVTDKDGNDISCEITYTKEGEANSSTDAPKDAGTYKVTITIKGGEHDSETIEAGSFTIREKPAPKPEPTTTYALTVKGGTVKVNGKDAVVTDGVIAVEKDAAVEVTFDKNTLSDAQVFDQWTITPDSVLNAVDPKAETISFTMPTEKVTIEAMTRDATIESEGPGVLGTAAMIGVGVAGTAVLGYQGYMIGTELYLNSVLPEGAAIPQNYGELAKLVWDNAGRPEPIALLAADATEAQKALTWAVENQLISADKAADASVTRWEVIRTWNQEQERKQA